MNKVDLAELLDNPELLQRVLQDPVQLLPEAEQEALRHCALVRHFDEGLYESILEPEGTFPFEQLATSRYVKRLPGKRRYALDTLMREQLLGQWEPQAFARLSAALAGYFTEQNDTLEALYHLVVADPSAAYQRLEVEIGHAAATFDLGQLYALRELLEERKLQLTPELNHLRRELRTTYETRALWANAYHETRRYQERERTKPLLAQLRAGKDFWALQLYAEGGAGKTMYLRALIAEHCVPKGWPVAKIDFDHVPQMEQVVDQPWRLLLTVADQLNGQIPGRPFNTLLLSNQEFIAPADPARRLLARPPGRLPPAEAAAKEAEVVEHFASVIPAGQPYLVIFDTLERLRHRQVTLDRLFDLLLTLRARSTDLRVILSGRFNLEEPLPEQAGPTPFTTKIAGKARTVRLRPFTWEEADRYLRELRNLPREDESLRRAIFAKSEGNPFKLTLLAELVERDASITADRILAYESADMAYLVERIVTHIEIPWVRWVLRYGVVPRQLSAGFVDEVIVPAVRALKEGARYDNTKKDGIQEYTEEADDPFSIEKLSPDPPDDLWERLSEYASDYSWVQWPEQGDSDTLEFQPEVVRPMRALLLRHLQEGRRIYLALQEAAFHYYAALAAESDGPAALREAVYHNYLARRGDGYWLERYAAHAGDDRLVRALANQAVDLAAEGEQVGERVQALAAYELAYRGLPPDLCATEETVMVETWLQKARQTNAGEHVGRARLAVLEGWLLLARADLDPLLHHLAEIGPVDDRTYLDLALLEMHALRELGRLAQIEALYSRVEPRLAALAGAKDARDRERAKFVERCLLEGAAQAAMEQERLPEADGYYERLLALAGEGDVLDIGRCASCRVQLLAAMAQEQRARQVGAQALERIRSAPAEEAAVDAAVSRLKAEIDLVRRQPLAAQRRLAKSEETPDPDPFWLELRARAAAACCDVDRAVADWEAVARMARAAARHLRVEAYLDAGRLFLDLTGDLAHAENYLELAASAAPRATPRLSSLRARLLWSQGGFEEARNELLGALEGAPPAASAKLMVWLLALEADAGDSGSARRRMRQLCADLERVAPGQRLSLLDSLHLCPAYSRLEDPAGASLSGTLLSLVPAIDAQVQDEALATLRLAEVQRVFGEEGEARRLLDGVGDRRLPVLLHLYRAYDRLGWRQAPLRQATDTVVQVVRAQPPQPLVLLLFLEQCERLLLYDEMAWLETLAQVFDIPPDPRSMLVQQIVDRLLDHLGVGWQQRISRLRDATEEYSGELDTYLLEALAGAREVDDGEATRQLLIRLGSFYAAQGDDDRARGTVEEALAVSRDLGDRQLVALDLVTLAQRYRVPDRYETAVRYLQEALSLAREGEDRALEAWVLGNLGDTYGEQEAYDAAVATLQEALPLSRESDSRRLEGSILERLGEIYQLRDDHEAALVVVEQALAVSRALDDLPWTAVLLSRVGDLQWALGNATAALDYLEQALALARKVGARRLEAEVLGQLGFLYSVARAEDDRAVDYLQQALEISRTLDDPALQAWLLDHLADVYGPDERALPYLAEGLSVMEQAGDAAGARGFHTQLGFVHWSQGDDKAFDHFQAALQIAEGAGDADAAGQLRTAMARLRAGAAHAEVAQELSISKTERIGVVSDVRLEVGRRAVNATLRLDGQARQLIYEDGAEWNDRLDANDARQLAAWAASETIPPWEFARAFAQEWQEIGTWLGRVLLGDRWLEEGEPLHLRLEIAPGFRYLPWELALHDGRPLLFGERFPGFYRGYPAPATPLAAPRGEVDVLLLRLGTYLEGVKGRGLSEVGQDVHQVFLDAQLRTEAVERPDVSLLHKLLPELRPAVLYFEVNVIGTDAGLALDFGGYYREQREEITVRELARVLGALRGAPLVILDVPAAPNLPENVRQLCLRNAFVAELMNHAHVGTVIATGLADLYTYSRDPAPVEFLVPSLSGGLPVRDVVARLWQEAASQVPPQWDGDRAQLLARLLPYAGTALFTREPRRVLEAGK